MMFKVLLLVLIAGVRCAEKAKSGETRSNTYKIARFFAPTGEIKKIPTTKLVELIKDFSDLHYTEMESLVDRLIHDVAINLDLAYSVAEEDTAFDYSDHIKMKDNAMNVAQFHVDLLQQLPDEIVYYTMKFGDDEEKTRVYDILKNIFEQNKNAFMEAIASHWEKYRYLTSLKLPETNKEIMNYFGLLEAYTMLGDHLRGLTHGGYDNATVSQVLVATYMFEAIDRVKSAYKQYKVAFLAPFIATYILQQAFKEMFRASQDPMLFVDFMKLYSLFVQKESSSVFYTLNDMDYTVNVNRKALVRIFKTAHAEFDMPDVFLKAIETDTTGASF